MTTCPLCGEHIDGEMPAECPHCHARSENPTESFAPVVVAEEPETPEVRPVLGSAPALVVRKGAETGERFELDPERVTIGRDPDCDIFLNDVTVSRSHAVLVRTGESVSIEDIGSLNGTYVNNVRVDKAILSHGDIVQVGMFQMVFLVGSPGSAE